MTVSGLMIASAARTSGNNQQRPTKINRSVLLKAGLLGPIRRRTLICWRSTRFSASSAALERNKPTSAHQISLQRFPHPAQHQPIRADSLLDEVCGRDTAAGFLLRGRCSLPGGYYRGGQVGGGIDRGRGGAFSPGARPPTSTVAVMPAKKTPPAGTTSMWIRTGIRWARRTQVKMGLTVAR